MDKVTLRASVISGILFLVAIILIFELSPGFSQRIKANPTEKEVSGDKNAKSAVKTMEMDPNDNLDIPIPEGVTESDITVSSNMIYKSVNISFDVKDNTFDVAGVKNTAKQITQISYSSDNGRIDISISLGGHYNVKWLYQDNHLYVRFFDINNSAVKVLVDPGHGGNDVGANRDGIFEKNITLSVCQKLKELAEDDEFELYFTREDDTYSSVEERAAFANETGPDLYVSVHINWYDEGDIQGTSVLYNSLNGTDKGSSYWLADILDRAVVKQLGTVDKGPVEGDSIYVVRYTQAPAALIELGFMTNDNDLNIINSDEGQAKAAKGIYEGIKQALTESNKIK